MTESDIEKHFGELMRYLFRLAETNPQEAFHNAGAVMGVVSGFRLDLLRSGRAKP